MTSPYRKAPLDEGRLTAPPLPKRPRLDGYSCIFIAMSALWSAAVFPIFCPPLLSVAFGLGTVGSMWWWMHELARGRAERRR